MNSTLPPSICDRERHGQRQCLLHWFVIATPSLLTVLSMPAAAAGCKAPEGRIVRCVTTGEVAFIEQGSRRRFSGEAFALYGYPAAHLNETGTCPGINSCPPREPMPEEAQPRKQDLVEV